VKRVFAAQGHHPSDEHMVPFAGSVLGPFPCLAVWGRDLVSDVWEGWLLVTWRGRWAWGALGSLPFPSGTSVETHGQTDVIPIVLAPKSGSRVDLGCSKVAIGSLSA